MSHDNYINFVAADTENKYINSMLSSAITYSCMSSKYTKFHPNKSNYNRKFLPYCIGECILHICSGENK